MFCRKCGEEVPDIINFCPKCGSRLDLNVRELPKNLTDFTGRTVKAALWEEGRMINGKLKFFDNRISFSRKSLLSKVELDIDYWDMDSVKPLKRILGLSHGLNIITKDGNEIKFILSKSREIRKYIDWMCQ